ncbi:MAG TPA: esterase [Cytophagales bacterium]|nr:esterase [Cytophagales bacterium]HAA19400.1 esterase [Cytophagales bacterium]HAP61273.1 esterase [Cytophagales bacterium]
MKNVLLIALAFVFYACDGVEPLPTSQDGIPIVRSEATFEVMVEEDVVYAEGLSHDSINSPNYSTESLKLDIYSPHDDTENRPLFMFIHGGGFRGGSKQQDDIVNIAHYFASRGWVFISVAYRKMGKIGTLPQEWIDNIPNLPADVEDPEQYLAMYPAHRDTKAALRWIMSQKEDHKINEDYVTVGGASAGAVQAITLGISNVEDYRDELTTDQDPSLFTTHLDETYEIKTIIDFWGSKSGLDALEFNYGHQRFDANDPPMLIIHGTADGTVAFSKAEELKAIYESNGVAFEFYPLEGGGHKAWNAKVDNKRVEDLAFDFMVKQQNLNLE